MFIVNTYALSCRSVVLSRVVPEISNLTKIIPHFVQEEPCQEVCNPGKTYEFNTDRYLPTYYFETVYSKFLIYIQNYKLN